MPIVVGVEMGGRPTTSVQTVVFVGYYDETPIPYEYGNNTGWRVKSVRLRVFQDNLSTLYRYKRRVAEIDTWRACGALFYYTAPFGD